MCVIRFGGDWIMTKLNERANVLNISVSLLFSLSLPFLSHVLFCVEKVLAFVKTRRNLVLKLSAIKNLVKLGDEPSGTV
jgi:hypothetical protein